MTIKFLINWLKEKLTKQQVLKLILNIWTILTMALFALDFFSGNKYDSSATAIGIIYIAILGIYISEKEYTRWQKKGFISRFLGEGFVGVWTGLMLVFVILAPFSAGKCIVPAELAIVYTSVIGAFAISQHSKWLHQGKERN